jgi:hypothetical protein
MCTSCTYEVEHNGQHCIEKAKRPGQTASPFKPTSWQIHFQSRKYSAFLAAFIPFHSTGATSLVLHPSAVVHELHSGLLTVRKSEIHPSSSLPCYLGVFPCLIPAKSFVRLFLSLV